MTTLTTQFAVAKMDGILGMAYPAISMNKLTPFTVALKEQGLIDQNIVTFKLSHTDDDSEMIVGGEDATFRNGDYSWNEVTQQAYWMIKIDSISLGGKVIASNLKGIVDTGTSLMVGGASSIGDIAKLVVAQDCSTDPSTYPDVVFTLSGKDYTLTGAD
jgi:hypothetical protein